MIFHSGTSHDELDVSERRFTGIPEMIEHRSPMTAWFPGRDGTPSVRRILHLPASAGTVQPWVVTNIKLVRPLG